jgi:hypothetical protein
VWSWRKRVGVVGGPLLVLVMVGLVLALTRSTSEDTTAGTDVNIIPTTTSSSTPFTTTPGRPNTQVRVQVVNSSGRSRAGTTTTDALRILGYAMAAPTSGQTRRGTAVQCRTGFEQEASTLARNVGGAVTVEPFPTPPPFNAAQLDCLVVLGR